MFCHHCVERLSCLHCVVFVPLSEISVSTGTVAAGLRSQLLGRPKTDSGESVELRSSGLVWAVYTICGSYSCTHLLVCYCPLTSKRLSHLFKGFVLLLLSFVCMCGWRLEVRGQQSWLLTVSFQHTVLGMEPRSCCYLPSHLATPLILSLKIRKCQSSGCTPLFQRWFDYFESFLSLQVNFRISLSISTKQLTGTLG